MPLQQEDKKYIYEDYCAWDDGQRWELIDGEAYLMSPAPSTKHQGIIGEIFGQLRDFLKGKPCKVFLSPFDVRLNADGEDDTVVQPDLVVICDRSKIDDKGCKGAPDLVMEILSPSSSRYDRMVKFEKYRQTGVKEYWIVDPDTKTVQVCILKDGLYVVHMFDDTGTAPVEVLPGCEIALTEVFAEI